MAAIAWARPIERTCRACGECRQTSARPCDLPPPCRTSVKVAKSINQENDGHEEEQIHRGADHWVPQAGRGGHADLTLIQHLVIAMAIVLSRRARGRAPG